MKLISCYLGAFHWPFYASGRTTSGDLSNSYYPFVVVEGFFERPHVQR